MQYMGTEMAQFHMPSKIVNLQKFNRDFWLHRFNLWYEKVHGTEKEYERIVIPDVRFPHEVDFLRKRGAIIIKIERPCLPDDDNHASEKEMDSIKDIDFIIRNNTSIINLYKSVEEIFSSILENNK